MLSPVGKLIHCNSFAALFWARELPNNATSKSTITIPHLASCFFFFFQLGWALMELKSLICNLIILGIWVYLPMLCCYRVEKNVDFVIHFETLWFDVHWQLMQCTKAFGGLFKINFSWVENFKFHLIMSLVQSSCWTSFLSDLWCPLYISWLCLYIGIMLEVNFRGQRYEVMRERNIINEVIELNN